MEKEKYIQPNSPIPNVNWLPALVEGFNRLNVLVIAVVAALSEHHLTTSFHWRPPTRQHLPTLCIIYRINNY